MNMDFFLLSCSGRDGFYRVVDDEPQYDQTYRRADGCHHGNREHVPAQQVLQDLQDVEDDVRGAAITESHLGKQALGFFVHVFVSAFWEPRGTRDRVGRCSSR